MTIDDYSNIDWENINAFDLREFTGPRRSTFLMKPETWKKLFKKQKGKCAICGKHQSDLKKTLAIDHNHITGEIRGLLCTACNRGLGFFQSDGGIAILEKAIKYIKR